MRGGRNRRPWWLIKSDTSEIESYDETPATMRHPVMRKAA
jgi:hypothetical protein